MQTIQFESNYGNFAYRLTAEIGEECTAATVWLCKTQGLGNLGYRVAGSAVDKALGVKTKKDARYAKRIEVLYSEQDAQTINATVSKAIKALEESEDEGALVKALKLSFAVTGEHVAGSGGGESKEATELWTKVQGLDEVKFSLAMQKLGFTTEQVHDESYDDASGVAACKKHIQTEKAKAKAAAAAGLGL